MLVARVNAKIINFVDLGFAPAALGGGWRRTAS